MYLVIVGNSKVDDSAQIYLGICLVFFAIDLAVGTKVCIISH